MNIFHFYKLKGVVGLSGYNLGFEKFYLPLHSLQTLHIQNHFKGTFYWGRILASNADYLIAFGYEHDVLSRMKFFYSLDGVFWNLMPNTSESAKILAQNCTSRMKGDPSYTIAVGDFGADLDEYGFSNDVGTLKEEDRLSATVEMITDEAAVVPRGALFKIDEETMVENPTFRGLEEDEAKLLYNYYHYRWPREKWRTRFFETSEYDLDLDFLDSIDKDIPEGTWSVKIETHFLEPIAIVRNLQWPGMTCFHCIKTPFHGFFYVGDGRKNMDMPFMINLKTPEEE